MRACVRVTLRACDACRGWTDEITDGGVHGVDGTKGAFPRYTQILHNVFREIGVWEKQSSAFFQAKGAESYLKGNVVFNLARAGFNFNDGCEFDDPPCPPS